ncbi:MAG: transcriptional regulator NrdR [Actinomycetota bacterium]
MRCPYCGGLDDRVVDSRAAEGGQAIRRRRECSKCARRFSTREVVEEIPLMVVKRNGSREPFDLAKIVAGIERSCKNRPVPTEDVQRVARQMEARLRNTAAKEVDSRAIGLRVLAALRDLDEVAYLRFASVYKDFQRITDFQKEVGLLRKTSPPKSRRSANRTGSVTSPAAPPRPAGPAAQTGRDS